LALTLPGIRRNPGHFLRLCSLETTFRVARSLRFLQGAGARAVDTTNS
jgi:hypothetical protein